MPLAPPSQSALPPKGLPVAALRLVAALGLATLVLAGLGLAFRSRQPPVPAGHADATPPRHLKGNPGPWGELEYIPILLETPDEFLSIPPANADLPAWTFRNYSVSSLAELFNAADVSPQEREWLLDQRNWRPVTNGFALSPPPEMLLGINRATRERIYTALAECGGNPLQEMPLSFQRDGLNDWFYKSGLSVTTIALTKSLLYRRGDAWCLSDWPVLLRHTESPAERRRLLKTTSRQASLMPRLRVTPATDVGQLTQYWGRGGRLKDIRPLLQSLALVSDGVTMDIVHLLPRVIRSRIYTYPHPSPPDGSPLPNAFWTSMNFFANERPDDRFQDIGHMRRGLAEDFYPVEEDYLLGDVLLLTRPDGTPLHAAVFVADDVVLTKHGIHLGQPWIFAKMNALVASYPSTVPLKLRGYRRKDL